MSSAISSTVNSELRHFKHINVNMTYLLISQERVWKLFAFPMKGYQYPWPQTVSGTLPSTPIPYPPPTTHTHNLVGGCTCTEFTLSFIEAFVYVYYHRHRTLWMKYLLPREDRPEFQVAGEYTHRVIFLCLSLKQLVCVCVVYSVVFETTRTFLQHWFLFFVKRFLCARYKSALFLCCVFSCVWHCENFIQQFCMALYVIVSVFIIQSVCILCVHLCLKMQKLHTKVLYGLVWNFFCFHQNFVRWYIYHAVRLLYVCMYLV
jgi:hypothetical protein